MKKKIFIALLGMLMVICFPFVKTDAAEEDSVDYSIQAIIPENQVNQELSYFDLRVTSGEHQTIQVQVNNFSDQAQKYSVEVNTAQTNGNMLIDYSNNQLPKDSMNQLPISEFVDYPKEIEIPAQKAGIISFDINVPEEAFDGILLGGIHVKKHFAENEKPADGKIKSEYDYILGLRLSENDEAVTPNIEFSKISPANISNNAGIKVQLKNPTATTIKNVTMTGNIYSADSDKSIISRTIENGSIAPDSVFDLFFFNGKTGKTKPLEAGNYRMEMQVKDENDHQWNFSQKFKISQQAAKKVNNQIFTTTSDNTLLYIVIGILSALVLGMLIFWFLKKRQTNKDIESKK
ncbi:DUF916 and DUF3324 domain-containing protein [Enterococcus sp. ALS3]|uniref:DUF916 and DUF3324 domain-containing protein n=1 Tax=Enterococcus alishanensis TaxID=1303817 RepID=A0ABS6TGR2_9ENTE|nr:DUF916 and DUF3324 domain-containing protein [Enterococcus alishanensis]MBV7392068.1 DUF916 and DUF3324 domain-containing protein [Enterococcus alishanensis]